MISCQLAACAEIAIRDFDSNNATLINIIEEIPSQTFPTALFKLTAFFLIRREEGDEQRPECKLKITMNGDIVGEKPLDIDFEDKLGSRVSIVVQGLPLLEPGLLKFSLIYEENEIGNWEMPVKKVGGPSMSQSEEPVAE
ncbi:MAG: hypothetical protein ACYC5A_02135 [Thermoleophilia bacterium]